MTSRTRMLSLILILISIVISVGGASIYLLYEAAIEQTRSSLVETAQSQARLIESVARFDYEYNKDYPGGAFEATLIQIKDAHKNYEGYGETGEFTLAFKDDNLIRFLISHRHYDTTKPNPIDFNSELAEPMRRALYGESGSLIGLDYRGETVLAAYEPVGVLELGIVAKIDISEVREPFLTAGIIASLIAAACIVFGVILIIRVTNPLIEKLRESEENFRSIFENAQVGIIQSSRDGKILLTNNYFTQFIGYTEDELIGLNFSNITHRNDFVKEMKNFERIIKNNEESFYMEKRYITKLGTIKWGLLTTSIIKGADGEPKYLLKVVEDISERKHIEKQIQENYEEIKDSHNASLNLMEDLSNEIDERKTIEERLRRFSAHLQTIREEEKINLSRELHDELGQSMTGLNMRISWLVEELKDKYKIKTKSKIHNTLHEIQKEIRKSVKTIRKISYELRPNILDDFGLISAIKWQLTEMKKNSKLNYSFKHKFDESFLDNENSIVFFRIFQEALTNITRHANASRVSVSIKKIEDQLIMEVNDNGMGIPKSKISHSKSLGILGMIERANSIDGEIKFKGVAPTGTSVALIAPIRRNNL